MHINCKTNCRTSFYAAEELKKYLMMMWPEGGDIPICYEDGNGFRIGLTGDFGIKTVVEKPYYDDLIYIDTDENGGIIAVNNERSILLAVYEFLRANGCRWIFVGKDGEFIPHKKVEKVKCIKKPYLRFRSAATEGAASRENVLDFIEFAPKIGLNSFMTEFDTSYIYHQQYYRHFGNKYRVNEDISNEVALSWKMEFQSEISKRSFMYHDRGHGWTAEPFGVYMMSGPAGFFGGIEEVPENVRQYYALVNGKRGFYEGYAINTNLCMSNPETRKLVAEDVVRFAKVHKNVDFLHVWLADNCDNHCECDECRKKIPTDWYVMMLNDIDRELTENGLDTKIVFIMYHELFWAPETVKFNNEDRFILLFAPISRVYTEDYGVEPAKDGVKPFVLNNHPKPRGMAENLAYLKKWREVFHGEAIAFEYHFHWVLFRDFSGLNVAKSVYDDVRTVKKAKLNGFIEDGTLRAAFPNGLPVYAWARAMFDEKLSFDEIVEDYYKTAYGDSWKDAYEYLRKLSLLFDFKYFSCVGRKLGVEAINPQIVQYMRDVAKITEPMKIVSENNIKTPVRCVSVSWQLMRRFCDFILLYSKAFEYLAEGKFKEAKESFHKSVDYAARHEEEMQKYFDLGVFANLMGYVFDNLDLPGTLI